MSPLVYSSFFICTLYVYLDQKFKTYTRICGVMLWSGVTTDWLDIKMERVSSFLQIYIWIELNVFCKFPLLPFLVALSHPLNHYDTRPFVSPRTHEEKHFNNKVLLSKIQTWGTEDRNRKEWHTPNVTLTCQQLNIIIPPTFYVIKICPSSDRIRRNRESDICRWDKGEEYECGGGSKYITYA